MQYYAMGKNESMQFNMVLIVRIPAQNTIENVIDLMVIMGIVMVLMETIMVSTGMWWILLVGC